MSGKDSQAWYWTGEWQAAEREAEADIAAGRVTRYESGEEFIASLEEPLTTRRHGDTGGRLMDPEPGEHRGYVPGMGPEA